MTLLERMARAGHGPVEYMAPANRASIIGRMRRLQLGQIQPEDAADRAALAVLREEQAGSCYDPDEGMERFVRDRERREETMPPPKPCTARVTWAALCPGPRPVDCPKWHHCIEIGPHAQHRVTWQGREYTWTPDRGGSRKGAGRPRKAPAELASVRIVALATTAEAEVIEAARGELSAGAYVLRAGLRAARRRR